MAKVYIAGPMRGIPQSNFPAFDEAAALGRSLGWTVISPAEMDREHGDQAEANPLPWGGGSPELNRMYATRDTAAILSLRAEDGDAIALLPGWDKSSAAPAEVALARWIKLRVLDARDFEPLDVYASYRAFRVRRSCNVDLGDGTVRVAQAVANGEIK